MRNAWLLLFRKIWRALSCGVHAGAPYFRASRACLATGARNFLTIFRAHRGGWTARRGVQSSHEIGHLGERVGSCREESRRLLTLPGVNLTHTQGGGLFSRPADAVVVARNRGGHLPAWESEKCEVRSVKGGGCAARLPRLRRGMFFVPSSGFRLPLLFVFPGCVRLRNGVCDIGANAVGKQFFECGRRKAESGDGAAFAARVPRFAREAFRSGFRIPSSAL